VAQVRIGIGGWTFAPWRGAFYPEGLPHARELGYASSRLTSIEINATFYRHQAPQSFAAWRDATPEHFVFAVKAHRATTHWREPASAAPAITRFLESGLAQLDGRLGPVLWQLPPAKKFDRAAMQEFLALLPARIGRLKLRHAVEARHPSFQDPAWIALAREHNVAVVIVDSDKQALQQELTADFVYARLQRNAAAEPEGYASAALDDWAQRFRAWAAAGNDVFAYFISGDKQRAPDAAQAMLRRLQEN
jgi:uncharacterized protein YecE (DUF72 family)